MFKELVASDKNRLEYEIIKLGAHPYAKTIALRGVPLNIKFKGVQSAAANILKQEAIAAGIDAAVHMGTVGCDVEKTDVLICGDLKGFSRLVDRLKIQPFGLKDIADEIDEIIKRATLKKLHIRGKTLSFEEKKIMAIINVTPDSFSDGGKFTELNDVISYLSKLKEIGINLVDIGGESSRPGAESIGVEEELRRVIPVVQLAVKEGFIVSVDTYKSKVAEECLKIGAHIINDISGFHFDADMPKVCADYNAGVCLMHIKGVPKTMQDNPKYDNLLEEIKYYLYESIELGLKNGLSEDNMIIDPGFGFGKVLDDNYLILKYLKEFESFGRPILVGLSRKSMVGGVIDKPVSDRVLGTKIVETIALLNGADIIRTHDVQESLDMMKIFNFYNSVGFKC
ncbi:dihydropteroate synthase [Calditerrivibrio nitroreducens]|uniref:dihydropteroate synthase n=1 Tax=Calditerrivibrio nitroreducens (strain DSM 19672 / NBRC 101217 / Yu37-1) TaxID=768670 RepID=E4TK76_CALNY|nr:dihydropteroate synthase [Calditerrivibrio nitroreducens]ADR19352.1 dihydropteroate synthase [Calditerrivibrio nitroreducens DSM 19672]